MALVFLIGAFFLLQPIESLIFQPVARVLDLNMIAGNQILLPSYIALIIVRLLLNAIVVALVLVILNRKFGQFPLVGSKMARMGCVGGLIGVLVMSGAILAIIASGNASLSISSHSFLTALLNGVGWLFAEFLGALGEELFGRVAVVMVAERILGWRGALVVSGLMFAVLHLDNPGATWIWLARLFLQGALLAYAVYRTGSIWWSVGYHTGWNFASAPLFGAAGSGYYASGHIFDFHPGGASLFTGGQIGPEGSIFAFAAVFAAGLLLIKTTTDSRCSRASRKL